MPDKATFAERFFAARSAYEGRVGRRVRLAELGKMVGEALKKDALSPSTVQRWEQGAVPDVDTIAAIAKVLGVRAGWLAFNEPPMVAPPPVVLGVPQLPRDTMNERTALTTAEAERLKLQQEQTAARARRRVAGEGSRRRGTG